MIAVQFNGFAGVQDIGFCKADKKDCKWVTNFASRPGEYAIEFREFKEPIIGATMHNWKYRGMYDINFFYKDGNSISSTGWFNGYTYTIDEPYRKAFSGHDTFDVRQKDTTHVHGITLKQCHRWTVCDFKLSTAK